MTIKSEIISVTPLAVEKLNEVLVEKNEEGGYVRVIAVPGENGGVQYMLSLEKDPNEGDEVVDAEGVRFLVDSDSRSLVEGTSIDYVDSLMRAGFTISNPNNQPMDGGGCGCGGGSGSCGCGGH